MEAVGDTALGGQGNHLVHHVARAGHHETHVVVELEHLGGSLHKVFRPLLHGDSAEEGHDLVLRLGNLHVEQFLAQGHHGVVYGSHLGGVDAVFLDYGLAREVRYGDDMVGVEHAVALDVEHCGIDVAARAVIVGGVHMDYQRLARHLLGVDAGGIGEPVV